MSSLRWDGRRPVSDDDRRDQILDLFVYMPIGLALEAKDLLPKLADRGRGQVALTRLAGKVASTRGQSEARKVVDQLGDVVDTLLSGDGTATDDPRAEATGDDRAVPIDDYDSLTAAKVIPRLADLDAAELEAVLAYEQAHRSRATVINRVRQLQG